MLLFTSLCNFSFAALVPMAQAKIIAPTFIRSSAIQLNNTIFRWVSISNPNSPGNNFYLVDINILDGAAAGIKQLNTITSALEVFPNPSNGEE